MEKSGEWFQSHKVRNFFLAALVLYYKKLLLLYSSVVLNVCSNVLGGLRGPSVPLDSYYTRKQNPATPHETLTHDRPHNEVFFFTVLCHLFTEVLTCSSQVEVAEPVLLSDFCCEKPLNLVEKKAEWFYKSPSTCSQQKCFTFTPSDNFHSF